MRPNRQIMESSWQERHGRQKCEKLRAGRVAIAGLGGLGSHVAVALTRAGVGHLRLIDFDVVEVSNLHRQHYTWEHIGRLKTEALREQLLAINPWLEVDTVQAELTVESVSEHLAGYRVVCEALDQAKSKAMLVNTLLEKLPETVVVAGIGMAGWDSANAITTSQPLRRLYVCGDGRADIAEELTLVASRVQVCAGHQAHMIIRLLTGEQAK